MSEELITRQMRLKEPEKRRTANRKGVFTGAYINIELRARLDEITERSFHHNLSLTIAELLTEAVDERDKKAEQDGL